LLEDVIVLFGILKLNMRIVIVSVVLGDTAWSSMDYGTCTVRENMYEDDARKGQGLTETWQTWCMVYFLGPWNKPVEMYVNSKNKIFSVMLCSTVL
jgi:hypothetical protein